MAINSADTHHYIFELTLGINADLTLSAGELATLVLNGLFALEERNTLFTGITEPYDRLRLASMNATGFERSGRSIRSPVPLPRANIS